MDKYFTGWIVGIIVLFLVAVTHQISLGASLDQSVSCKILVSVTHVQANGFETLTTKLETLKGYATEVVSEEYFVVDFTNDMFKKGLLERFNSYVQTRHVNDCAMDKLVLGNPGTGGIEARFKGDSEDY